MPALGRSLRRDRGQDVRAPAQDAQNIQFFAATTGDEATDLAEQIGHSALTGRRPFARNRFFWRLGAFIVSTRCVSRPKITPGWVAA